MNKNQAIREALDVLCVGCMDSEFEELCTQEGEYLVYCTWGGGGVLSIETQDELLESISGTYSNSHEDRYDLQAVNLKTGREIDWDVEINITLMS